MACCCVVTPALQRNALIMSGYCCCSCAIGVPSQAPGSNPSTTTSPTSAPVATTSGLLGLVTGPVQSILAQATYSANQKIASSTGTNTIQGSIGSSALIVIAIAILAAFLFLKK